MAHGASSAAASGPTLLETVASHEESLLTKVDGARTDARGAIEAAQEQALTLIQETNAALDAELAERRRAAAESRAAESERIERETKERVDSMRAKANVSIERLKHELVAQLLPGQGGGSQ